MSIVFCQSFSLMHGKNNYHLQHQSCTVPLHTCNYGGRMASRTYYHILKGPVGVRRCKARQIIQRHQRRTQAWSTGSPWFYNESPWPANMPINFHNWWVDHGWQGKWAHGSVADGMNINERRGIRLSQQRKNWAQSKPLAPPNHQLNHKSLCFLQ